MDELLVGFDLWAAEADEVHLAGYREALRRLLAAAEEVLSRQEVLRRLTSTDVNDGLESLARVRGGQFVLERRGYTALAVADDELF